MGEDPEELAGKPQRLQDDCATCMQFPVTIRRSLCMRDGSRLCVKLRSGFWKGASPCPFDGWAGGPAGGRGRGVAQVCDSGVRCPPHLCDEQP